MLACNALHVSPDITQISSIHHNNGVISLLQVVNDDGAVSYLFVLSICRTRTASQLIFHCSLNLSSWFCFLMGWAISHFIHVNSWSLFLFPSNSWALCQRQHDFLRCLFMFLYKMIMWKRKRFCASYNASTIITSIGMWNEFIIQCLFCGQFTGLINPIY